MKLLVRVIFLGVMVVGLGWAMEDQKECVSPYSIIHSIDIENVDCGKEKIIMEINDLGVMLRFSYEARVAIDNHHALCEERRTADSYIDDERIDLYFGKSERLRTVLCEKKKCIMELYKDVIMRSVINKSIPRIEDFAVIFQNKNNKHKFGHILRNLIIQIKKLKEIKEYYGFDYDVLIDTCRSDEKTLDYYIANADEICSAKRFS